MRNNKQKSGDGNFFKSVTQSQKASPVGENDVDVLTAFLSKNGERDGKASPGDGKFQENVTSQSTENQEVTINGDSDDGKFRKKSESGESSENICKTASRGNNREKSVTLSPPSQNFDVANEDYNPVDVDWSIRAFEGTKAVKRQSVVCQNCRHFQRNRTNPPDGLGQCLQRQKNHPDRGQWPKHESYCGMYEVHNE